MEVFLIYLFKASVLVTLFYGVYFLLLRKDTFFVVNRYFLILGIISSILLPLLEFTSITYIEPPSSLASTPNNLEAMGVPQIHVTIQKPINWWVIGFVLYCTGILILLMRFIMQLISLKKLLHKKKKISSKPFHLIETKEDVAPFSFFKSIVYNPALHSYEELDMILTHEKIHAKQYHTIDLLLSNLFLIFQWVNPFAWLFKKSIEQNLEFIADHEVINQVSSKKEYQLTLVNISSNNYSTITNNFYQSLIKKRILMLNKQPSKKKNLIKFVIILPLLSLFLWSFNTKEVIEYSKNIKTIESEMITSSDSTKTYSTEITRRIDKKTTIEELTEFKRFLNENFNIEFKFNNINFKNNYITNIQLQYEDSSGSQGTYISNDDNEFIKTILVHIKIDSSGKIEKIGFSNEETSSNTFVQINGENVNRLSELGKYPIYIVNGKQYQKSELIGKTYLTHINPILYLSKEAISKYGEVAKDGVVILESALIWKSITTKVDDDYRNKYKRGHVIAITDKEHEYVFFQSKK